MMTDKIKVTHLGEDYATVEVDGVEFQTSLGLGEALLELNKLIEVNYYSSNTLPAIGEQITRGGDVYEVIDNSTRHISTMKLVATEDEE